MTKRKSRWISTGTVRWEDCGCGEAEVKWGSAKRWERIHTCDEHRGHQ